MDWPAELAALPDKASTIAYTTYLDAPSFRGNEDPANYLASLAAPYGMRLGGENTGGGTLASLALSLQRARSLGYVVFDWMDQGQVVASSTGSDPSGPSWSDFAGALG